MTSFTSSDMWLTNNIPTAMLGSLGPVGPSALRPKDLLRYKLNIGRIDCTSREPDRFEPIG